MDRRTLAARGASFHLRSTGQGPPLLLLHGWPEFSLVWEPVMQRLAGRHTLWAPDLRGFGDSDKPDGPWGAEEHARDMLALLEAISQQGGQDGGAAGQPVGVVGHDVGGAVMMAMARLAPPGLLSGLFFFDFVHPGIGARMGTPDRLIHIWYQSFHQLDLAPDLVGSSREACRRYIGHFLQDWAHRKDAFDDVLEAWTDNFLKPGNLLGGFQYYRAAQPGRLAMIRGDAPRLPPIDLPACVRWAEHDPLFPPSWTDTLGETFSNLDLAILPGVGHFPHREDPDRAAAEIEAFFARLG